MLLLETLLLFINNNPEKKSTFEFCQHCQTLFIKPNLGEFENYFRSRGPPTPLLYGIRFMTILITYIVTSDMEKVKIHVAANFHVKILAYFEN